jgi:hypothetical protein
MPRPQGGYKNAAGQSIPGTHDPISRYMDQTALKIWAYNRGKEGLPLWDRSAIDIGSTVHAMAELDLKGRPDREIEAYAHNGLTAPDDLRKAFTAFEAFREWREQCHVRAIAQETVLISEKHQYGGTPDTIAMIGGGLGLVDFKTSPKPYPDHLIALAAHGRLWEENNPQQPITSYHLLLLPKDGSGFKHHAYSAAHMEPQWRLFRLYLEAYRLDKACAGALTGQAQTIKPAGEKADKPRLRTRAAAADKPPPGKTKVTGAAATMAELLRAYGHVKEAVAC